MTFHGLNPDENLKTIRVKTTFNVIMEKKLVIDGRNAP